MFKYKVFGKLIHALLNPRLCVRSVRAAGSNFTSAPRGCCCCSCVLMLTSSSCQEMPTFRPCFFWGFFFWESPQVKTQTSKCINYGLFFDDYLRKSESVISHAHQPRSCHVMCFSLCGLSSCLLEAPVPWGCLSCAFWLHICHFSSLPPGRMQKITAQPQLLIIFGSPASCTNCRLLPLCRLCVYLSVGIIVYLFMYFCKHKTMSIRTEICA